MFSFLCAEGFGSQLRSFPLKVETLRFNEHLPVPSATRQSEEHQLIWVNFRQALPPTTPSPALLGSAPSSQVSPASRMMPSALYSSHAP